MTRPCVWCREQLSAEQLDAGKRCASCDRRIFDDALATLAAGLPVRRRRWAA